MLPNREVPAAQAFYTERGRGAGPGAHALRRARARTGPAPPRAKAAQTRAMFV